MENPFKGNFIMKPGQQTKCPHCGKDCFLVKKTLMDGWTKVGDILACSCCSAKIADLEDEKVKAADSINKFSKLENLLLISEALDFSSSRSAIFSEQHEHERMSPTLVHPAIMDFLTRKHSFPQCGHFSCCPGFMIKIPPR